VAPYSEHANEHSYWAGYDEDQGPHRGKGPKGYTRTDERIMEHVCDVLMEEPHIDASGIEVEVQKGEVTLRGTIDNRPTKRRADDLVKEIIGVKAVRNNLRVKASAGRRPDRGNR
jgi:osmotically-inducible protein OsmY